MIFSYIWGANVGGLFTALGITSIVLGLTLQNSVGQIISGLLVLFEQPFQLGDWIDTPTARGRVVEVNWRATHIDTGSGLLIMPNSVLAAASFTNSQPAAGRAHDHVTTVFSVDDPPDDVVRDAEPGGRPRCRTCGRTRRRPASPVGGTAVHDDDPAALSRRRRRRADRCSCAGSGMRRGAHGLHLDEAEDEFATPERRREGRCASSHPRCG